MIRLVLMIAAYGWIIVAAFPVFCADACRDRGESKPLSVPVTYDTGVQEKQLYEGSYALVIGAANYRYFDKLPAVSDETQNVANALARQNFAVHMVCDPTMVGRPGFSEVKAFLAAHAGDKNRLVIFLSGHGWVDKNRAASASEGYFAGVDSPQNSDDLAGARVHGYSSEEIIYAVQQSRAKHVLVVVDACHSSAMFVTVKGGEPLRLVVNQPPSPEEFDEFSEPARQFITAADDERAPSPSAFTAAFVLGIEGGADLDGDGVVRFSELSEYIKKMVQNSNTLRTRPVSGLIPQKLGEISDSGNGEIVFRYQPDDKAKSFERMVGVGKTYLLVQTNTVQATPQPTNWPDSKYYVAYYTKRADNGRVASALVNASIPTHETAPVLPETTPSNGIACTASTPISAVKMTAKALIDSGVPIYVISKATKHVETRSYQIQVLHYARALNSHYKPLTNEEINQLQSCPGSLGLFNSGQGAKDHGDD